ncbi:MAG: YcjF family protein [Pseudomonadota bacterium]
MTETRDRPADKASRGAEGPFVIALDSLAGPGPADAPEPEDDTAAQGAGQARGTHGRTPGGRRSTATRLLIWGAGGLLLLAGGLFVDGLVTALFARAAALGWIGTALAGLLALGLGGIVLVELAAMGRLKRLGRLQALAARGRGGDRAAAEAALEGLDRLTRGRAVAAPGRAALAAAAGDTPDPVERLALADELLVTPLDVEARRVAERTARLVAGATAVIPMPLLDIAVVGIASLGMTRRIASVYGGIGGVIGTMRLMRMVAGHLIATGAVAATDDLLDPVLGHGVLGRVSRRLGEAAVNAALTARLGAAALEVCRPIPPRPDHKPRARSLLKGALFDWRDGSDTLPSPHRGEGSKDQRD